MKKKLLALTLCMVLVLSQLATIGVLADTTTDYTLDETTKTYTVYTADGLMAVAAEINGGKLNYSIKLAADIDMTGKNWIPLGTDNGDQNVDANDKVYEGSIDGGNFTIKNLTIQPGEGQEPLGEAALIGLATKGCVVKNLKIVGADIKGYSNVAAVIAVTRKGVDGLVTVENVHVRNTKIESTRDKYAYAAPIIGQAGTTFTKIENCTVWANVLSAARASALIGGESVTSNTDNTKLGITVNNVIVTGSYTSSSSNAQGVGGFLGYHSTIPLTLTNCVSIIEMFNTGHKDSTLGSFSVMLNKLSLTATNCIGSDALLGKINDTTMGASEISNSYIYKLGETAAELDFLPVDFVAGGNAGADSAIKVNGVSKKWDEAKLPVLNSNEALKAKALEIFAGNTVITANVIEELLNHEHAYTLEILDSGFLKSAATCTEPAVYYKSCVCGGRAPDEATDATFINGDALGHSPSERWSDDDDNHWHVCSTCLEHKTDEAAHTYGEWAVTKEATEKREGERAKACTVCGHEITEKTPKKEPEATTAEEITTSADDGADAAGCDGTVLGMGTMAIIAIGAFCFKKKKHD